MKNHAVMALLAGALMVASATAQTQTTVVTTSPTTGAVPVFGTTSDSTTKVTTSSISLWGVDVGVNAASGQSSNIDLDLFNDIGDVKLQYTTPINGVEINDTAVSGWAREFSFASTGTKLGSFGALGNTTSSSATLTYLYINANQNGATYGSTSPTMALLPTGNVGIGTATPTYSLDVTGKVRSTLGFVFPDGSTQITAFSATLCGGDYAESVDVTGERKALNPGDLLVIDPTAPGKFLKASTPYSTLVAGVYSTKPGTVGRRQITPKSSDEVPMALMGIVPTKVTAENGPIKVGDLLVSSSTQGMAMKGTDRNLLTGAVIGKALGSLDSGTGVIEVLVTLQ